MNAKPAKIAAPEDGKVCRRPRIASLLHGKPSRSVTWLSAPAGAGKTQAVAAYLKASALESMWYTVDERDADPVTLFVYLREALRQRDADAAGALPVMTTDHAEGGFGYARRFFERFFAHLPPEILLVFDDCQEVGDDARWFQFVREACAELPSEGRVFFLSRRAPPPVFARLLAERRLTTLSWDELKLDDSEADQLITQLSSSASRPDLETRAVMVRDAQGWAAGLVLLLARVGKTGAHRPGAFTPPLFDYFASEAFAGLTHHQQRFLMATATLPYLSSRNVEAFSDEFDLRSSLRDAERQGLFLNSYEMGSETIYRYHPLFRQFLRIQSEATVPATELRAWRSCAAHALIADEETELAFDLLVSAHDWASVEKLVLDQAPKLLASGRGRTLARWRVALPPTVLETNPWLAYWCALAHDDEVVVRLRLLRRALGEFERRGDGFGFWSAWCGAVQVQSMSGRPLSALDDLLTTASAARASGLAPSSDEVALRVDITEALAYAVYRPQDPRLTDLLGGIYDGSRHRSPQEMLLAALTFVPRCELARLRRCIGLWEDHVTSPLDQLGLLHARAAEALFLGEHSRCRELLRRGLELSETVGFFEFLTPMLSYASYSSLAVGDSQTIVLLLDEWADVAASGGARERGGFTLVQARASIAEARPSLLADARAALDAAKDFGMPLGIGMATLAVAEAEFVSGNEVLALEALSAADGFADVSPWLWNSARLVRAHFELQRGNLRRADELLADSLGWGERQGLEFWLFPERHGLEELLSRALGIQSCTAYARRLAGKRSSECPPSHLAQQPGPPPAFSRAVREAFRHFYETRRLAASPLLHGDALASCVPLEAGLKERVAALQRLLTSQVVRLRANPKTENFAAAVHHTFIEPAGTQLLAAEACRMSYGSYRRYLAAGLAEIAYALWSR